jgi:hypothetical protein
MKTHYEIVTKDGFGQYNPVFPDGKIYKTMRNAYDNVARIGRIFNLRLYVRKVQVSTRCPYCSVEVHELKTTLTRGEVISEESI